jgi:ATP-binding cassette subfamily B (MDR/TAP) protein 1
MTSLLLRQYDVPDPNSHTNNIFIGGHPVSSVRISHLRDQIAICAQDPVLFAASILENVAVGLTGTPNELRLDKSNLEVVRGLCQEALRKAQALTFVEKLPQGMDSVISGGKTGVLSGGQKQR